MPSALNRPTTRATGASPTGPETVKLVARPKPPVPVPNKIETSSVLGLAVAMSRWLHHLLKSPPLPRKGAANLKIGQGTKSARAIS